MHTMKTSQRVLQSRVAQGPKAIGRPAVRASLKAQVVSVAAPDAPPTAQAQASTSSNTKLPSTHLDSSKKALEQLKDSAVNRKFS